MNPLRTNLYRKSLSLRKTKTDRVDARTIAAMLLSDTGLKPYTDTAYHARLNIEDTLSAANTLTADAFRTWVLLALNQGGFVWTGELDDATKNELIEHAYLHPNGDGFVFHAGGGGESAIPKVLEKITAFYPDWTVRDIRNIMGRLDDILADDRANEIIEFWGGQYENLRGVDRVNAKNLLLYDFSIVLNWWLHKNFKFEPGDVIIAGKNAKNLRIKNGPVEESIRKAMAENHTDLFPIHDGNIGFWNGYYSRGLIDLKTDAICEIVQKRGHL